VIEGQIDSFLTMAVRGGLLDTATLVVAFIYAVVRWTTKRTQTGQRFVSAATGVSLIHGLPILPLFLLILAGFGSDSAVFALIHTHRVILGAAGAVALFSILEERPAP
jgi:hypothetical protein